MRTSTILGRPVAYPLVLAPTGFTRIADPEGELAVARAAERAGLPYTLSTLSTRSIEEVRAVSGGYDLITLDRMLPEVNGLAIVTTLRALGIATPILMISALSDVDERVRGLRAGGDDYLAKPFAIGELEARIRALLRRGNPVGSTLRFGKLDFDPVSRQASVQAREIVLLAALDLRDDRAHAHRLAFGS